jgi:dolichol-phosphate mannosyltransferase
MPSLSLILPTFNEALNIVPLLDELELALAGVDYELIVVDDNSPDETWRIAESRAVASQGRVRVIRRMRDPGLTRAIQEGIDAARGDRVGWMDCDLSMPAALLPALLDALAHADIAVGSRYVGAGRDRRQGAPLRRVASRIVTGLARLLLLRDFRDYTSGFVVAKRAVLDRVRLRGIYGEYFIDLVVRAHRQGFKLAEVPYTFVQRQRGASKTEPEFARNAIRYLGTIGRLWWEAF